MREMKTGIRIKSQDLGPQDNRRDEFLGVNPKRREETSTWRHSLCFFFLMAPWMSLMIGSLNQRKLGRHYKKDIQRPFGSFLWEPIMSLEFTGRPLDNCRKKKMKN
jgi:hypothetical protein